MTSVQYHNNQYYNPNDQRQNHLLPSNNSQRPVSIYDNYLVTNFQNGDSNYDHNDQYQGQQNNHHNFYQAPIVRPEDVEEDDDDDDDDVTNNQYNNRNYNNCDTSDNNQTNENEEDTSTKTNLIKNQKNSVKISSNNNLKNKSTSNINNVTSPSLTYCLSTTVPQNLSASKISGRHAPTRNSLRHSRMIVLSRSGRGQYLLLIYFRELNFHFYI